MKTFLWILLSFFTILKLQAQDVQVTLVDPCSTIEKKSTIIINDNAATTNALSRSVTETNTVNFTLSSSVNTSAGVYNADGNLIRTLWSGVRYDAGNYKAVWSGVMDDGTLAPPGNYQVKVLTNNVKYTWEGVIGNTSDDFTGNYYHKGNAMAGLCFAGTKAFYPTSYSEHQSAQRCFLTTNPQRLANEPYLVTGQASEVVCSDGNIVYWGGWSGNDGEQKNFYIFGELPGDNANGDASKTVSFSNGQAINNFNSGTGRVIYPSVISLSLNNENGRISSICVQKSGNLLFIVRAGLNQLQIIDKRPLSGAILQALTYTNPTAVSCDDNGNLYMVYNNTLHKFSVTTAGVLTDLNISFNNLTNPGFVDVSPDNSTIAISDNATNQVKFYNVNGGSTTNILGTGISYVSNPYAADNKFNQINFVKYQPDGSIWVGDRDNNRYQHFNANFTYKENIAFVPVSRSAAISQTDPTRIFSNFIEYERDYSKPLAGTNGSWKFKANWRGIYSKDEYLGFTDVNTYYNGRTYGTISEGPREVELTATGLRETGTDRHLDNFAGANNGLGFVGRDGTVFYPQNQFNDHENVYKRVLTGYTVEGNPVRGPKILFVSTPSGTQNVYSPATGYEANTGHTNASDRYIFFNQQSPGQGNYDPDATLGYHLGAMKPNETSFLWKASQSTRTNFQGSYPTNGDFDIGNGWPGQHSLTHAMVYDHDIFWNVNGEFWKSSEINIWNHFSDDGLLIGHFGTTKASYNAAEFAGNAISTGIAKVGNDYYIVHCDESVHAGVHSWHVSGLNTIAVQAIPITVSATNIPISDPSSLMGGISYKSTFTGGNGWIVDQPINGLSMPTSLFMYRKDSVDLYIGGNTTKIVRRSLNNNKPLNAWSLIGGVGMQGSYAGTGPDDSNYLELLDVSGKIIVRFEAYCDIPHGYHTYLRVNNIVVADGDINEFYYPGIGSNFYDFKFSYIGGNLTFKIGSYNPAGINGTVDTGADKSAPAYLRVTQKTVSQKAMVLYKLKFTGK